MWDIMTNMLQSSIFFREAVLGIGRHESEVGHEVLQVYRSTEEKEVCYFESSLLIYNHGGGLSPGFISC